MSKRSSLAVVTAFFLILALSMAGCSDGGNQQQSSVKSGPRIGAVTNTEAAINWDTYSVYRGAVSYRIAGESGFTGKVLASKETDRHNVTLTNLKPNTKYEFQVEGHPAIGSFKTAPTESASFVFVTMADNRGQSDTDDLKALPLAFTNIITDATTRKAAFAVNAGDIFYGKNSDINTFKSLYQSFKTAIQPLAFQIPYYISPGNHEMSPYASSDDKAGFDPVALFKTEFPPPAPQPALNGYEGTVFSWDYGKVHFVSIATNQFDENVKTPKHAMYYVSDAQIKWLDNDLKTAKSNGAQFIFVFGHANAFSDSTWPADGDLGYLGNTDKVQRDNFWNVLVANKVDAYVCGHRHFFDNSTHDGVVQWMNGNSGSVVPTVPGDGKNQYTVWTVTVGSTTTTVKGELFDDKGNKDTNPAATITFTK
jgi:hypothetical protein